MLLNLSGTKLGQNFLLKSRDIFWNNLYFTDYLTIFNKTKKLSQLVNWLNFNVLLFEPQDGLEPSTFSLRMKCSTN